MKLKRNETEQNIIELFETYKISCNQKKQILEEYPALVDNQLYQDELNNSDTKMFECFMGEMATAQFSLGIYQKNIDETEKFLTTIQEKYGDDAVDLVKESYIDKKTNEQLAIDHKCSEKTITRKLKQYIKEVLK